MHRVFKLIVIWLFIGVIYMALEGLWRIPYGGYANIVMLPIGGLCGLLVGGINQVKVFYQMKVFWQAVIGACAVTVVEFLSGYVLNIWLGLGIWDYSRMPFNLHGQICLLFSMLWFLLMPTAIWLEDWLRYAFWREGEPYSLLYIYKEFVTYE